MESRSEENNTGPPESPVENKLLEEFLKVLKLKDDADLRTEGYGLSAAGMELGLNNAVAVRMPETKPWKAPVDGLRNMGLCTVCQKLFSSDDRVTQSALVNKGPPIGFVPEKLDLLGGQHHTFVGDCNAAAQKGCPICFIMMEWALDCGTNNSLATQQGRFSSYTFRPGGDDPWAKIHAKNGWILEMSLRSLAAARGIPVPVAVSKYHTDFIALPVESKSIVGF